MTLPGHIFSKFLRDHVQTVPGIMQVKFEVRSFVRIGLCQGSAICMHTQTKAKWYIRQCSLHRRVSYHKIYCAPSHKNTMGGYNYQLFDGPHHVAST